MPNWIEVKHEPPHDKVLWAKAVVRIRHNPTGEIREIDQDVILNDNLEAELFIWEEGNFSCDCNRGLFFANAAGEDDPDRACGMDEYSVQIINPADGSIIYDEFTE